LRDLFKNADRLASREIVEKLAALEGRPWAEFRHGRPITVNQLARLLRPFSVSPASLEVDDGTNAKGYDKAWFKDAFSRNLPDTPSPDRQSVKPAGAVRETDDSQSVNENRVYGSESFISSHGEKDLDGLTVQNEESGDNYDFLDCPTDHEEVE
jgi:hypothetical protein